MYTPSAFAMSDRDALDLARSVGAGHLITVVDGRIDSTLVPFVLDDGASGLVLRAHMARVNANHHHVITEGQALIVVTGPDTYVSPSWYPSKQGSGRVVPTWNYSVAHLRGRLRRIDDPDALRDLVSALTDLHERNRTDPWSIDDATEEFIEAQLRAIVGIEIVITEITGKAKLSQNRPEEDRQAVRDVLRGGDDRQRAVGMAMG
jgi:transcriptional regulator